MKKTCLVALFLGVLSFLSARPAVAQVFSLSPGSLTKKVGEEFVVSINIDTQGKTVKGADTKLSFDTLGLEITKVEGGSFFATGSESAPKGGYNVEGGIAYLSYGFDTPTVNKAGSGTFAKLTLKGKKTGTSTLTWACSAESNDTNIWDANTNDIIVCGSITNAVYTFVEGESSSGGSTAAATATPVPAVPVSGITLPTVLSVGVGALLTIFGIALSI